MSFPLFFHLQRFVAARLSPEGAAGVHLTLGVAVMLAAAWLFGVIAGDVVSGERITLLDVALAHYLHRHASAALTAGMLIVTHWHGMIGTGVMALMLAAYFHLRRATYWRLAVMVVVPGGMLLNVLLKYVFQRARPSFDDPLLTLTSYSFPSGHTVNAVLLYGLLASWLVMRHRRAGTRAAIVGGACAMVALVGLSRMVLGVHYLSDVLAASVEGGAWLAVCITAISTLRRHREAQARNHSGSLH